ncbi:hypothetical protein MTP10_17970 [Nonomuraea sp. 3-1Str]|uniref:oxidoreductase n=1 Tax=Nonomuraea sp. 3-1Str TaxID=2929801 RepID=UPI00285BD1DB|nr:hypothetical protein [Nonomuraea sp. 3-1Str]
MTRNRAGADGVPGELMTAYYAQRASAGLIIAEAGTPNAVGQTYPNIPAIHRPAHVAGWRRVTGAVHAAAGDNPARVTGSGHGRSGQGGGVTAARPHPVSGCLPGGPQPRTATGACQAVPWKTIASMPR